jgi:hypothetical protein
MTALLIISGYIVSLILSYFYFRIDIRNDTDGFYDLFGRGKVFFMMLCPVLNSILAVLFLFLLIVFLVLAGYRSISTKVTWRKFWGL